MPALCRFSTKCSLYKVLSHRKWIVEARGCMYEQPHSILQMYVIVIVRLLCDMAQAQHEARGREAPEGECCV